MKGESEGIGTDETRPKCDQLISMRPILVARLFLQSVGSVLICRMSSRLLASLMLQCNPMRFRLEIFPEFPVGWLRVVGQVANLRRVANPLGGVATNP